MDRRSSVTAVYGAVQRCAAVLSWSGRNRAEIKRRYMSGYRYCLVLLCELFEMIEV